MNSLQQNLNELQAGSTVPLATLEALVAEILAAASLAEAVRQDAAETIVYGQLRGSTSHGIFHLPTYVQDLRRGAINPAADFRWSGEEVPIRNMDADNGLGVVAGRAGMDGALAAARTHGIGLCSVRNGNHFGVGAFYAKLATDRGMIGIALSNASATMAPWGGAAPLLGTNPIAMGFPLAGEPALIIDMATSAVARARLRKAKDAGEAIPDHWALDGDGAPTCDAAAAMAGTVKPFGGAKGYGLALAVELLCASLAGGDHGWAIRNLNSPELRPSGVSHFFLAIDPDRNDASTFAQHAAEVAGIIRESQPRPDGDAVRLPGDRATALERERRRSGIPMDEALHAALTKAVSLAQENGRVHRA